jgi:type II secretory pathway pseudopilin PulG
MTTKIPLWVVIVVLALAALYFWNFAAAQKSARDEAERLGQEAAQQQTKSLEIMHSYTPRYPIDYAIKRAEADLAKSQQQH